jgi:hypothetical protein
MAGVRNENRPTGEGESQISSQEVNKRINTFTPEEAHKDRNHATQ